MENETEQDLNEKLAELGLKKQIAYVPDSRAKEANKNAARQARFRKRQEEKRKQNNEVLTDVPVEIIEAARAAGGFEALVQTKIIEKIVEIEVPAELNSEQLRLIELGRKVENLIGFKRKLINIILRT